MPPVIGDGTLGAVSSSSSSSSSLRSPGLPLRPRPLRRGAAAAGSIPALGAEPHPCSSFSPLPAGPGSAPRGFSSGAAPSVRSRGCREGAMPRPPLHARDHKASQSGTQWRRWRARLRSGSPSRYPGGRAETRSSSAWPEPSRGSPVPDPSLNLPQSLWNPPCSPRLGPGGFEGWESRSRDESSVGNAEGFRWDFSR